MLWAKKISCIKFLLRRRRKNYNKTGEVVLKSSLLNLLFRKKKTKKTNHMCLCKVREKLIRASVQPIYYEEIMQTPIKNPNKFYRAKVHEGKKKKFTISLTYLWLNCLSFRSGKIQDWESSSGIFLHNNSQN